jgi:signal transduction histidine kinase
MSLFLKLFLWFWLAIALIVSAVTLVNWSTQSEPLARQWQTFVGEAVSLNSQTAAQIYEAEGIEGLNNYLNRSSQAQRVNSVGFFDENKKLIAGNIDPNEVTKLSDEAMQSGEPEFLRLEDKVFAAKRVTLKNGANQIYILELKRFQPPAFFTTRLILQILTVVLIGGLLCYGLARYLTSPISKLRFATRKFAEGDLSVRINEKVSKRSDEISKLANDFDEMAEHIEALVTAEKRLTQDISHELRSPLARLNVALELARSRSNEETKPMIDRIESESNMLNEMLSRLLTLSKLESGSGDFDKMEVNLTKIFDQVVADADFEAQAKGKSVKVLKEEQIKVFGNENLLNSAIENVLRNAVKYTKDNTAVEVSLTKNGKGAIVSVRDHGTGVPEHELEKLFKPFYRLQTARERKTGGIGLGLAIAERAVNAHDGTISAKNLADGLVVEIKVPFLES